MARRRTDNPWIATQPLLRRLLQYREWLRAGRSFTAGRAAQELEVSERTVRRDLEYARCQLRWDVEYERDRNGFVLVGSDLPLPLLSLRQGELVALLVGEQALRQYSGTPYAEALQSAFGAIVRA